VSLRIPKLTMKHANCTVVTAHAAHRQAVLRVATALNLLPLLRLLP
jgi:hypothetical protein